MSTREYETLYGVGLLDDLHNYFPAILYEPEQFRNVAQILTYIQRQTHRRFDLFTFGQTAYNERRAPQPPPPPSRIQVRAPVVRTTQSPPASLSTPIVSVNLTPASGNYIAPQIPNLSALLQEAIRNHEEEEEEEEEETNELQRVNEILANGGRVLTQGQNENTLTLLSALLGLRYPAPQTFPAEFLNPVIVRPTQEQVDAATTLTTLEADSSENCAICQDILRSGEQERTITHCGHAFHSGERGCIDTWFQQNVHCPVCRHDIRERVE